MYGTSLGDTDFKSMNLVHCYVLGGVGNIIEFEYFFKRMNVITESKCKGRPSFVKEMYNYLPLHFLICLISFYTNHSYPKQPMFFYYFINLIVSIY